MAIYVMALDRGGYSASGGCFYDPRDGGVLRLHVLENEVIPVTIEFNSAPSEFDYRENGIDGSEPIISGNTISLQFQELQPSGAYEIEVTFSDGSTKVVRFIANEAQPFTTGSITTTDDDDVDYGAFG